jgi:hypothetical protein
MEQLVIGSLEKYQPDCASPDKRRMLVEIVWRTKNGPVTLLALIDSGSDLNIIRTDIINRLSVDKEPGVAPRLQTIIGEKMTIGGRYTAKLQAIDARGKEKEIVTSVYSAQFTGFDIVLGMPWLLQANPQIDWTIKQFVWGEGLGNPLANWQSLEDEIEHDVDLATGTPSNASEAAQSIVYGLAALQLSHDTYYVTTQVPDPLRAGSGQGPTPSRTLSATQRKQMRRRNIPTRAATSSASRSPSADTEHSIVATGLTRDSDAEDETSNLGERPLHADTEHSIVATGLASGPGPAQEGDRNTTGEPLDATQTDDQGEGQMPSFYEEWDDLGDEAMAAQLPENAETDHAIELEDGKLPPHKPIYNLSQRELQLLREYLKKALERGWIRESKSPAGAPILFVPKADGSYRLCVDYRGLNAITIKNRYPLPLISELMDRLSHAKIFTKLDLRDAYHRLRIRKGDEWKTAFKTRYGHFEYLVMPFGLANAPATFQTYIHKALGDLVDTVCIVYLDDILIFSETEEQHIEHVRMVMERLRQWKLYIKLSKCVFHTTSVEFLGFVITPQGVLMDQERVKAIQEWPTPRSFKEVQIFLGFANFYRRFVHKYSDIARPLNTLLHGSGCNLSGKQRAALKKEKKPIPHKAWEWSAEAESSFQRLKDAFTHAPAMQHFDPSQPLMVITDASDFAYAGILLQPRAAPGKATERHWHPIAYHSKGFQGPAVRYDVHDKELMAIFECFKVWRHYLEGARHTIRVCSDHNNLRYFMSTKSLTARQARYAEWLAAYDFVIEYKPGKQNPADGLSRRPDYFAGFKEGVRRSELDVLLPTLHQKLQSLDALKEGQQRGIPYESGKDSDQARTEPDAESELMLAAMIPRYVAAALVEEDDPEQEGQPESLLEFIKLVHKTDPVVTDLIHARDNDDASFAKGKWSFDDDEGLLRKDGRVWIPKCTALRHAIMHRYHNDPRTGHRGPRIVTKMIQHKYDWPRLQTEVKEYVDSCPECQSSKSRRHKPYGQLQPLPVPDGPWQDIAMDFITDLPKSGVDQFDAVLVIIDRFSKYVRYIACHKTTNAQSLARLVYTYWISQYGAPRSIVSDRGKQFDSAYWETLCYYFRTTLKYSTAFHPQTDGQTERQNQELEAFLRIYTNWQQNNWSEWLLPAQLAHNSTIHASTGYTPLQLALGRGNEVDDGVPGPFTKHAKNPNRTTAEDHAERLRNITGKAKEALTQAKEYQAVYYNKKHQPQLYAVGDLVLLSSKNLKSKRPSKKLDAKYVGPFPITDIIGSQAYKLELPESMSRIHPVFHVSLLEPYRSRLGQKPGPIVDEFDYDISDTEQTFEVEDVVAHEKRRDDLYFRVRWTGWDAAHDTWMAESELQNARAIVTKYKRQNQLNLKGISADEPKRRRGRPPKVQNTQKNVPGIRTELPLDESGQPPDRRRIRYGQTLDQPVSALDQAGPTLDYPGTQPVSDLDMPRTGTGQAQDSQRPMVDDDRMQTDGDHASEMPIKRPRGRPPKVRKLDQNKEFQPKKKRGRPRKKL